MTQSQSSQWQRSQRRQKHFQCPCGKQYLSYPALYTHIKQTHNGVAPGQIKRPDTHLRGRPKAPGVIKFEQHTKTIKQVTKIDPLPSMKQILPNNENGQNRQIRQIYENQPVYKLIMNDKDKILNPKLIKQENIYDVKMGQGIIEFFNSLEKIIQNKNYYDQIILLIVLLTEHVIQQTQDQNVLQLGSIGLMPQFVNYFMIHDFKKPVERLKLENLWIFQHQNAMKILDVFFLWMLYKKYTLTRVTINTRYLTPQTQQNQNNPVQDQQIDPDQCPQNSDPNASLSNFSNQPQKPFKSQKSPSQGNSQKQIEKLHYQQQNGEFIGQE